MQVGLARVGLLLCTAFLWSAAGCSPPPPSGPSKLSATVNGLKINATIDGPAFIHPDDEGATISAGFSKIVVDREEVVFNGRTVAKLPEDVKEVDVTLTARDISVSADGVELVTAPLKR